MDNKPQINPEHPRIKNRDSKRQTHRDDLAKTLSSKRSEWNEWRQEALDGYSKNKKFNDIK